MTEEQGKALSEAMVAITQFQAALLTALVVKGVVTVEEFNEISNQSDPVIAAKIKAALDVSAITE